MLIFSPLATIYHVILQVRASATANAGIFQKNEAATRAALIDPILRGLGWDTANVRMVEPEKTVENKQSLDYVLKDAAGTIRSVIEAKKLGESLDKLGHVGALIGYAFSLKPKNFFITDGLNWHCYSPTHSHYQPIETLNLEEADPIEAALYLIRWLDAAQSGYGINTLDTSTSKPSESAQLIKQIDKTEGDIQHHVKHNQPSISSSDFIDLTQISLLSLQPGQKPKELRLPNGTTKKISTWKDILLEVCRLVLTTNHNIHIPLKDKAGKKRFLFSTEEPLVGSSTTVSHKGNSVFIYTHYSAADCVANALYATQYIVSDLKSTAVAVRF